MDRLLAINAIGKSVTRAFKEGDMDTAWLWEKWRIQLEEMTDREFDEHYGITESANIS